MSLANCCTTIDGLGKSSSLSFFKMLLVQAYLDQVRILPIYFRKIPCLADQHPNIFPLKVSRDLYKPQCQLKLLLEKSSIAGTSNGDSPYLEICPISQQ